MDNGATDSYYGSDLGDCQNHALVQNSGEAVTVTFSTNSTDGWLGDDAKLYFTDGKTYSCPLGWVDYPDRASYRSTCA